MNPLPKWVGYLATTVAVAATAYAAMHPGAPLPTWIVGLMAVVNLFTHSATGTGGVQK